PQAHVALARATRAVTGPRQEQAAVELLELELEPALDAPARAHVLGKRCGELPAESRPVRLGFVLVVDARGDEQAVGVAVEYAVTFVRGAALRPEGKHLARAGDRVRERGVVEAAGRRAEHAIEGVHQDLDRVSRDLVTFVYRRRTPREQLVE